MSKGDLFDAFPKLREHPVRRDPYAVSVLLAICERCQFNRPGLGCIATTHMLSQDTGINPKTVKKKLALLRLFGLIVETKAGYKIARKPVYPKAGGKPLRSGEPNSPESGSANGKGGEPNSPESDPRRPNPESGEPVSQSVGNLLPKVWGTSVKASNGEISENPPNKSLITRVLNKSAVAPGQFEGPRDTLKGWWPTASPDAKKCLAKETRHSVAKLAAGAAKAGVFTDAELVAIAQAINRIVFNVEADKQSEPPPSP